MVAMNDLDRLWSYGYFDRQLRLHYGLDRRRHLRYNGQERVIYYVVRRSIPRNSNLPGRFAVDARTLDWLLTIERHGRVENAFIVFVEGWKAPPQVVFGSTAREFWARLERIVPFTSSTDPDSEFWWCDDHGEPQDAWLGPVLRTPPF